MFCSFLFLCGGGAGGIPEAFCFPFSLCVWGVAGGIPEAFTFHSLCVWGGMLEGHLKHSLSASSSSASRIGSRLRGGSSASMVFASASFGSFAEASANSSLFAEASSSFPETSEKRSLTASLVSREGDVAAPRSSAPTRLRFGGETASAAGGASSRTTEKHKVSRSHLGNILVISR